MERKLNMFLTNNTVDTKGEEILSNFGRNRKIIEEIFSYDKKSNQSKDFMNSLTKDKKYDYKSFMHVFSSNKTSKNFLNDKNRIKNIETTFTNTKKNKSTSSYKVRGKGLENIKPLRDIIDENKNINKNKLLYGNITTSNSRNKANKKLNESKDDLSNLSTDFQPKKIFHHKKYYSLHDNHSKRRRILLQNSDNFFKYHDEKNFLRSLKKLKSTENEKILASIINNKHPLFSQLQRIKTNIAFGKVYPLIFKKNPKNIIPYEKILTQKNIFKPNEDNIIDIQNIDCYKNKNKIIKKSKNQIQRNIFGVQVTPQLTKKKILKNILPKEVDYNTRIGILDIIQEEVHPLLRYQKKLISQNTNIIGQELNDLFTKVFKLGGKPRKKISEYFAEFAYDDKFYNLIKEYLEKEEKKKEVGKFSEELKELKNKQLRKKHYLYNKIKKTMIFIAKKIERYEINVKFLFLLLENKEKYIKENKIEIYYKKLDEEGSYFFKVIKAGDTDEIIKILNKTPNSIFYKDEFNQTPLHILAKRNMYKFVSLFISRFANINAQDISGRTPLMIAAQKGYKEFVTMLLFEIADPNIKDVYGKKAFEMTNDYNIKRLLINIGAVYNFLYNVGSMKTFDDCIKKSLEYFYCWVFEIDRNFDNLLLFNRLELKNANI